MSKESLIKDIIAIAEINGHNLRDTTSIWNNNKNEEHITCVNCRALAIFFDPSSMYLYNINYVPCTKGLTSTHRSSRSIEELEATKDWLKSHGWVLTEIYDVALGIKKAPERRSKTKLAKGDTQGA